MQFALCVVLLTCVTFLNKTKRVMVAMTCPFKTSLSHKNTRFYPQIKIDPVATSAYDTYQKLKCRNVKSAASIIVCLVQSKKIQWFFNPKYHQSIFHWELFTHYLESRPAISHINWVKSFLSPAVPARLVPENALSSRLRTITP